MNSHQRRLLFRRQGRIWFGGQHRLFVAAEVEREPSITRRMGPRSADDEGNATMRVIAHRYRLEIRGHFAKATTNCYQCERFASCRHALSGYCCRVGRRPRRHIVRRNNRAFFQALAFEDRDSIVLDFRPQPQPQPSQVGAS